MDSDKFSLVLVGVLCTLLIYVWLNRKGGTMFCDWCWMWFCGEHECEED